MLIAYTYVVVARIQCRMQFDRHCVLRIHLGPARPALILHQLPCVLKAGAHPLHCKHIEDEITKLMHEPCPVVECRGAGCSRTISRWHEMCNKLCPTSQQPRVRFKCGHLRTECAATHVIFPVHQSRARGNRTRNCVCLFRQHRVVVDALSIGCTRVT